MKDSTAANGGTSVEADQLLKAIGTLEVEADALAKYWVPSTNQEEPETDVEAELEGGPKPKPVVPPEDEMFPV